MQLTQISATIQVLVAVPAPLKLSVVELDLLPSRISRIDQRLVVLVVESILLLSPVAKISRVLQLGTSLFSFQNGRVSGEKLIRHPRLSNIVLPMYELQG